MDLLWFCSVLCLLCLCARLFICALWSPAGKGLTSWLSFVVSAVSLSLSHWYPGSGVVLDCIDSLIFEPLLTFINKSILAIVAFCFSFSACFNIFLDCIMRNIYVIFLIGVNGSEELTFKGGFYLCSSGHISSGERHLSCNFGRGRHETSLLKK